MLLFPFLSNYTNILNKQNSLERKQENFNIKTYNYITRKYLKGLVWFFLLRKYEYITHLIYSLLCDIVVSSHFNCKSYRTVIDIVISRDSISNYNINYETKDT